jgi:hypothetical protein
MIEFRDELFASVENNINMHLYVEDNYSTIEYVLTYSYVCNVDVWAGFRPKSLSVRYVELRSLAVPYYYYVLSSRPVVIEIM